MAQKSKRRRAIEEKLGALSPASVPEAVNALKGLEGDLPKGVSATGFDQTVEIAVRLGVDPKQADQIVRGSIVLPHGIGKTQRVLVFCQGPNVEVAQEAGADHAGGKELADKIKDGWMEFDVAIATPDMMSVVGPLGRVLGPRGLMPSPKAGTVTQDVAAAVRDYKAGKVEFRNDSAGIVHCVVGKMSFEAGQLTENVEAFLNYIRSLRPTAAKGVYIRSIALSATQLPGIPIIAA
ncbi:MAG: 50S ribosomal protein L1 [Planctomycetota bacterium]|nr:MAG: 50S ribosomal protein L1 [Planctomycetota bacterium]REJ93090.1 MAG: 50S ribosomal protein L1 [Planctomycetota bacterium]REK30078.1 MAG: 50S ribosomal protein L1 [Planctomycetota bacterium]REK37680.1 MAG: 50S ribosomal protein L1 [Planctomycetota bacterium]